MKKLSIGKVSKITDLPQSVIRYWETVFDNLEPEKSEGGTRRYSQDDINLILEIKNLLYDKKYTIAGARSTLSNLNISTPLLSADIKDKLSELVAEIDQIIKDLSD
jgi:DNA-binding transcriptional MerR regulator